MDRSAQFPIAKDADGKFTKYAFPGGYPVYHVTKDNGVLCADCANKEFELTNAPDDEADPQWKIVASDANYENDGLYCDNCGNQIEAAYSTAESEA